MAEPEGLCLVTPLILYPWRAPGANRKRAAVDYQAVLEEVAAFARPLVGRGQPADYIPALAEVDTGHFGMAVADVDGGVYGVGDWERPFSVQSISKAFSLALVLAEGGDRIWERVGTEPSGNPFNSLVQLEYEHGIPRNPFINAGALVVTDRLQTLTGDASTTMLEFLRAESGNPEVSFDPAVAKSESEHGDRNAALAHFMASYGNLDNPVPTVLEHYFWQCSIEMSCKDLALAGGFPGPARAAVRRHPAAAAPGGQADQRGDAHLRDVRRRRGLRLPRGPARQERRGRRHRGGDTGPLHAVRVEPGAGRPRQFGRGRRRAGPLHDADRMVGVLGRVRWVSTGPATPPATAGRCPQHGTSPRCRMTRVRPVRGSCSALRCSPSYRWEVPPQRQTPRDPH
ncbi:hypothetical protein GCM10020000_26610 [Streptomyces olivoverticillatus]